MTISHDHGAFLLKYATPEIKDATRHELHKSHDGLRTLISHGTDADRSKIMNNANFPNQHNLHTLIAVYGTHHSRHELLDKVDQHSDCFRHIAKYGNDEHRHRLIDKHKHVDVNILMHIAQHGNDSHRDKLLTHPNLHVRAMVAKHGNKEHATKLQDDPARNVAMAANSTLFRLSGKSLYNKHDESILSISRKLIKESA